MFSDFAIGIYFGIGLSGWMYAKMQRQTGGNTTNSLVVAGGAGLLGFLLVFTLLGIVF